MRIGLLLQVIAALCTMLGLAHGSTAQWSLATSWQLADAAQRVCLAVMFDVLNVFLGNGIREFVGELTLCGSFLAFAISLHDNGAKKVAASGAVPAVTGWIGMFRNITPSVQLAADVTSVLPPLLLIDLGIALHPGEVG